MSCGGGNGWFKKNPWLAERSQVTTRWGKKSPTFDDGDDSMEVFSSKRYVCVFLCVSVYIRVCVCVVVCVCVCIHFWLQTDHPLTCVHSHTQVRADFRVNLKTLHCKSLSPHAAQTVAETQKNTSGEKKYTLAETMEEKKKKKQNKQTKKKKLKEKLKIKFAALNVLEHHIESLGVTIF